MQPAVPPPPATLAAATAATAASTSASPASALAEVQAAMSQLPSESELSWLGLNRRLGLSDGAALFSQIEAVRGAGCHGGAWWGSQQQGLRGPILEMCMPAATVVESSPHLTPLPPDSPSSCPQALPPSLLSAWMQGFHGLRRGERHMLHLTLTCSKLEPT